MSPQEVEAATDAFAPASRTKLPKEGSRPRTGNRATFENELSKFRVTYRHDYQGLAEIELRPEFDDCLAVFEAFAESFGEPVSYNESIILRTVSWHDEANDNHIVMIHSHADICQFKFTSLANFRERQLSAAEAE